MSIWYIEIDGTPMCRWENRHDRRIPTDRRYQCSYGTLQGADEAANIILDLYPTSFVEVRSGNCPALAGQGNNGYEWGE